MSEKIHFFNCLEEPFSLHGFHMPKELGSFTRMPYSFDDDKTLKEGITHWMRTTTGGRVRFITDSPVIHIHSYCPYYFRMGNVGEASVHGFDMYVSSPEKNGKSVYAKTFFPTGITNEKLDFEGSFDFGSSEKREITLYFPLFSGVDKLLIGLKEGCFLSAPNSYKTEKPMVFYGSSVTHGASASRPGMTYPAILSRWLGCDFINLGFNGSDWGEATIAEYISALPMSAYIHGYGYNEPSLEDYPDKHYRFYKIIRGKNPELPIIMMSSPVEISIQEKASGMRLAEKRKGVMSSYIRALQDGDTNVYFVDGFSGLGDEMATDATVDGTHPTDLGFWNIAKKLYPILDNAI